jgi:hypothetical protein
MKAIIKIDGVPGERAYNALSFGRQLDYRHTIAAFKARAKHLHYSAKGTSTAAGFRDFKALYQPTQWFAINHDAPMYHDDSFEVWYIA